MRKVEFDAVERRSGREIFLRDHLRKDGSPGRRLERVAPQIEPVVRESANRLAWVLGTLQDREDLTSEPSVPKVEYTAMLLGATGNVGGHILHLLMQSALCKKVVVVTRRNVAELANPKVQQVIVNMDTLEEELAPHAKGVD